MFEVGDVVKIRSDLAHLMDDEGKIDGLAYNRTMNLFAGYTATVVRIDDHHRYELDISAMWAWNDAMLEPSKQSPKEVIDFKPQQRKWSPKPLEESVKAAIESIRTGYYKGTYLKLELEAQLDRGVDHGDSDSCYDCDGEGTIECSNNHEAVRDDEGNLVDAPWGGQLYEESCSHCEEGYMQCASCNGHGDRDNDSNWNDGHCLRFIENHISQACRNATVYSRFCYDGSVDSEYMCTVPLSREGLGFAIEYIKAFKALAKEIGNGIDVAGAGMHITVLRSEDGRYPGGNGAIESVPYANFKTNMTKLMPALYLLASEDNKSRSLSYRQPGVERQSHGHAIAGANSGNSGALEWRVFETCYRRPAMLLDFICVIAKGLSYYAPVVKPVKFRSKIGKLEFADGGNEHGVHRYFQTEKHLIALKQGLKYLLPDHRTESEVLRLRNFKLTPEALKRRDHKIFQRLEANWIVYRKTMKQEAERREANITREYSSMDISGDELKALVARYMAEWYERYPNNKRDYLKRELSHALNGSTYATKYSITI